MNVDYATHYDQSYWTANKTYRTPDGVEHKYNNPSLTWDGFDMVADTLLKVWRLPQGASVLDIGCGGGDFARRLMRRGISAYGCDISEFALDNVVPEMRERVGFCDISQTPEFVPFRHTSGNMPAAYDAVTSLDLMEHLYPEDLDRTFEWIKSRSMGKLFLLVATVGHGKQEFIHKKGTPIPLEWEATAVSGHVHVRTFEWWARYFTAHSYKIDWARMYLFQKEREANPAWAATGGWNMGSTFFLELA